MFRRHWSPSPHRLAVIVLLVLLVFLASSAALKGDVDTAAAWTLRLAQTYPRRGGAVFLLYSALSAMLAFASSVVLVPTATAVWGRTVTFLLLWGGWILGAAASYGVGRLMTPLLVRIGYGDKLGRYQRFVSAEMGFWAVLFFCLAVPSEIPGYLFGSAHYRFSKFLLAMSLAESLYAAGLVLIGESLLAFKPSAVILALGVAVTAVVLLRRRPA